MNIIKSRPPKYHSSPPLSVSPGYASLDPEYAGLWRLLPYAKKFITAAICGTSASGALHLP